MIINGQHVIVSEWSRDTTQPRTFKIGAVMLRGFKIELVDAFERNGSIQLKLVVAERSTGIPVELTCNFVSGLGLAFSEESPEWQAEAVTRALTEFVSHEVRELVQRGEDGPCFRDPHAGRL